MPVRSCFPLPIPTASTRAFSPTEAFRVNTYSSSNIFPSPNAFATCQFVEFFYHFLGGVEVHIKNEKKC
jgi:hypothetical protein